MLKAIPRMTTKNPTDFGLAKLTVHPIQAILLAEKFVRLPCCNRNSQTSSYWGLYASFLIVLWKDFSFEVRL